MKNNLKHKSINVAFYYFLLLNFFNINTGLSHSLVGDLSPDLCDAFFDTKKTLLSQAATSKLNLIITKLKDNSKTKLEIITRTDSNVNSNAILFSKQSYCILTHLTTNEISKTRLKTIVKGEPEILNNCMDDIHCSEKEHQVNRRTKFKFFT